jgi:hypothetical protein
MKTPKNVKKLDLAKTTVRALSTRELAVAVGGCCSCGGTGQQSQRCTD